MRHLASGRHPVDLSGGRMLAPGEVADLDPTDPHHQALVAAGHLVALTEPPPPPKPTPAAAPRRRRTKPDTKED